MTKIVTKTGQLFAIVAIVAALLFVYGLVAEAQQKGAPEQKATPAAGPAAKKPEQKAGTPAEPTGEYAACSPEFSGEEIAGLMKFASELLPDVSNKLKPILLKCDFGLNENLLGSLASLREEMAEAEFENPDQEKEFRREKAKELELQIAMSQQPINQVELKKLVGDLFEIRQKNMQSELADLEKHMEGLKKRIEERQKLKDQIIDRKAKELSTAGGQPEAVGQTPGPDPLAWD